MIVTRNVIWVVVAVREGSRGGTCAMAYSTGSNTAAGLVGRRKYMASLAFITTMSRTEVLSELSGHPHPVSGWFDLPVAAYVFW